MAKNKTYLVYGGNGEELSTLKTLAAAKKLADEEGGMVLCDGECVYQAEKSVTAGQEDPITTDQDYATTGVEETVTEKEMEQENYGTIRMHVHMALEALPVHIPAGILILPNRMAIKI